MRMHGLFRALGYERIERPVAAVEKAVKGVLFDCRMCGQCVLSSTGMSCPMNCPKTLRNGPCGGVRDNGNCEVKPRDALRLGRGLSRQSAHSAAASRRCARCSSPSISACRAAPRGCGWCASEPNPAAGRAGACAAAQEGGAMRFEDEPVPGYPLPILPGHTSPGRFERVLRAGGFAVTTELAPPDSADPGGRVQARAGVRRLCRCHQRHRRQRRELPHVEPRRLRAADARRLCADHADLLPRQEPHRDSGRHSRRRRDGRVQHAVPDRRRRAGGRSSAGEAGVRSGLRVAARDRAHACATIITFRAAARSRFAPRVFFGAAENPSAPAARLARAAPGQEGRRRRAIHPDAVLLRPAAAARLHGPGRGARAARQGLHPRRRRSAALGEDGRMDAQERSRHARPGRRHRAPRAARRIRRAKAATSASS